ncbi:hypothetical protein [Rhizobium sp. CNPSo 4039]|uniref:hypothetical protein n=1 Tax=Rhizobium sp. CNPSo 4039 TaxID=3021409 RepID=UPI00254D05CF|nr:hypothetical protein [Rhizobium sp. CNPSo 4039]MDK4715912.1 hypothetical protein [Rhizobium sp. CNPSo 4039]
MRKLILLPVIVIVCAVSALAAFIYSRDVFYVVDAYRYRLTVNFIVDGKPLSAAGIVQETIHKPPCILLEQTCGRVSIKGDAIPVTFPNGKTAFVLLEVIDGHRITTGEYASSALPSPPKNQKMNVLLNQDFGVSNNLLPNIIYFSNLDDPYSMTIIDPEKIAEVAGQNASYLNATIRVTEEPITRTVSNYLLWLSTFKPRLDATKVDFFRYTQMQNLVSYLRRDDL